MTEMLCHECGKLLGFVSARMIPRFYCEACHLLEMDREAVEEAETAEESVSRAMSKQGW